MSSNIPWRRHAIGVASLALMVVAAVIWSVPGASTDWAFAQGVCMKAGTTLLMFWLAFPALQRLKPWKVILTLVMIAALVFNPRLIRGLLPVLLYIAPLLVVIWLMRLPAKRGTR